jgi:hypothetical protein
VNVQRSHEGFDGDLPQVFIGGLEPAAIILADYDPRWPERFAAEAKTEVIEAIIARAAADPQDGGTWPADR